MMERLNKVLARAGVASRRAADRMIAEGRVTVNGAVVRELGVRVDPVKDAIKVDGTRIPPIPESHTYLMLNKPRGCVTTLSDPEGRPTIKDFLGGLRARVYPVGRLDFNSEGLLLLTDDGDLARELMHPGRGVEKTYAVKVRGTPIGETLRRLRAGIRIEGRMTLPARVAVEKPGSNSWLRVTVVEGRKHQVRRMLQAVGHPVLKLKRIRYGGLDLGDLPPGGVRSLTAEQVAKLRRAAAAKGRARRKRKVP
jgi:pseudouridine synthase